MSHTHILAPVSSHTKSMNCLQRLQGGTGGLTVSLVDLELEVPPFCPVALLSSQPKCQTTSHTLYCSDSFLCMNKQALYNQIDFMSIDLMKGLYFILNCCPPAKDCVLGVGEGVEQRAGVQAARPDVLAVAVEGVELLGHGVGHGDVARGVRGINGGRSGAMLIRVSQGI